VVGVFFTPDGRILLLRHVYRRLYPWGLPAGFLNAGESPEDAAVREVREEIGLIVKVTRTLDVQAVRPRHMEVVVLGTVLPDQPMRPNAEIFEGAFVPPGVLPPGMMPSQAEIVRRAVAVHVSGPVLSTEV
jgi:ADP-ribose pyrophosphatase YjhB (NUDIX family)